MGYSLEIEMVSCNQDCRHCYAKKDKEAYVRSLDWLQRQRDLLVDLFGEGLLLNLAYLIHEITLHPEFFEIVEWLRDQFACEQTLCTNGSRIARDERFAHQLLDVGISRVQITLYGVGETHDSFAHRRGAFDDALKALRWLRDAGESASVDVAVNVILHKDIIKDLPRLYAIVTDELGLSTDRLGLMTTAPVGNNVDDLLAVRASELQAFDWVKLPASYMTERQITNRALAGEYDDRRVSFAAYRDSDPFPEPKMVLTRSGELYRFFSGFSRRTYLGSLSEDHHCLAERIKQGGTPGQQESNNVPVSQLARLYGGDSDFVYGRSNLIELWRTKYYQEYCGPGRK